MERLFQLINLKVSENLWKPIKLSKEGPALSHLAFADDLVLFAEASLEQAEIIQSCLNAFYASSGQKINIEKTCVFFSKNVDFSVKTSISSALGFQQIDDLGKYLGIPTHHSRVSRASYQGIIDRLHQRMSGWKARNLSFAGRLTLTKSVLAALPSYTMQTVQLPRLLCDEADRIFRNFLWGDNVDHRRHHAIGWQKLCLPKEHGGLGLRRMRDVNTSFMMKNCWSLITEPHKLWVKVIRAKYKCSNDTIPKVERRPRMSNLWQGICDSWNLVIHQVRWRVGNGRRVNFWLDNWLSGNPPLLQKALVDIPLVDLFKSVKDYTNEQGEWELSQIESWIPHELWIAIQSQSPPSDDAGMDRVIWNQILDGEFTIKSAYGVAANLSLPPRSPLFKTIWKWKGPERVRVFLWRVAHGSLLTNSCRARRRMTMNPLCSICLQGEEDSLHVLRDYRFAQEVWSKSCRDPSWMLADQDNLQPWLLKNLSNSNRSPPGWNYRFAITLDSLWHCRNKAIFQGQSITANQVVDEINARMISATTYGLNQQSQVGEVNYNSRLSWMKPPEGILKLNCDGAVSRENMASCGGVIRDSDGRFVVAFTRKLGMCSILKSKL
uniref:Ribonuclease H protein At1g65750 family n=1 Tax=Cajanus cajan TaxID=3821 RepID=A0A151RA64_CAJCA|nr:Putative ribonuclease H protein At1g65750 family [Cajanus cajan]